jgi:hypothetical protein
MAAQAFRGLFYGNFTHKSGICERFGVALQGPEDGVILIRKVNTDDGLYTT